MSYTSRSIDADDLLATTLDLDVRQHRVGDEVFRETLARHAT